MFVRSELLVAITSPSFVTLHLLVSEIAKCIETYVCSKSHRNWLLCVSELHGHTCPYHNVLLEAVYCCFTRTALLTELFSYLYDQS